jgi:hypothetical protein
MIWFRMAGFTSKCMSLKDKIQFISPNTANSKRNSYFFSHNRECFSVFDFEYNTAIARTQFAINAQVIVCQVTDFFTTLQKVLQPVFLCFGNIERLNFFSEFFERNAVNIATKSRKKVTRGPDALKSKPKFKPDFDCLIGSRCRVTGRWRLGLIRRIDRFGDGRRQWLSLHLMRRTRLLIRWKRQVFRIFHGHFCSQQQTEMK